MKERLTGAIILVALMVLLVPELLTGPIRTKSPPAASATTGSIAADGGAAHAQPPLRTYTLTLGPAPPAHPTGIAPAAGPQTAGSPPQAAPRSPAAREPSPGSAKRPVSAAANAPGQGEARQRAAAPAHAASHARPEHPSRRSTPPASGLQVARSPAHRTVREARSPASSGGWVVQLGVFADHRNAVHLAHGLERKGFRISVSRMKVRSRPLWRVSTAPPRERAAVLDLAARLRRLGHRGEVVRAR